MKDTSILIKSVALEIKFTLYYKIQIENWDVI